ncbi:MAG: AAA family ATPase [Candidatus Shapirobacteria bacterium]
MIVFINGSFGVGKSSVAELLAKKIPNSLLYDAEEVGYMLRKIGKPMGFPEDFQDLPAWRILTVKTAELLKQEYNKNLIMPLCVWNEMYIDEIVSGLKAIDKYVYHFCLVADRETILKRHSNRNDSLEVTKWVHERVDKCLKSHRSPKFEVKVQTENKSAEEVAEEIVSLLGSKK